MWRGSKGGNVKQLVLFRARLWWAQGSAHCELSPVVRARLGLEPGLLAWKIVSVFCFSEGVMIVLIVTQRDLGCSSATVGKENASYSAAEPLQRCAIPALFPTSIHQNYFAASQCHTRATRTTPPNRPPGLLNSCPTVMLGKVRAPTPRQRPRSLRPPKSSSSRCLTRCAARAPRLEPVLRPNHRLLPPRWPRWPLLSPASNNSSRQPRVPHLRLLALHLQPLLLLPHPRP